MKSLAYVMAAVVATLGVPVSAIMAQSAQLRLTPPEIAAAVKGGAGAGTSGVAGIALTAFRRGPGSSK